MDQSSGCRVQGAGCRAQGAGSRVRSSRELVAVEPEGVELLEGGDRLGDDGQEVLIEEEDLEVHEQPDFVGEHLRDSGSLISKGNETSKKNCSMHRRKYRRKTSVEEKLFNIWGNQHFFGKSRMSVIGNLTVGDGQPRQSVGKVCHKSICPWALWLPKVITACEGGFEAIYPLHHSGVVGPVTRVVKETMMMTKKARRTYHAKGLMANITN